MSAPTTSLPLDVQSMARLLCCRLDGIGAPIMRGDEEVYPSLVHMTIHDPASPAFRASFAIKLPDLTPVAILTRYAEVVASFAAAQPTTGGEK